MKQIRHAAPEKRKETPFCLLTESLSAQGAALMNQQCWVWGKDVRREAGNALMLYGFQRQRPLESVNGATMYTRQTAPGCFLTLWGFGLWYGETGCGGIYINRFKFEPQWLPYAKPRQPLWSAEQLPLILNPNERAQQQMFCLLPNALREIARYERWIAEMFGAEYRSACVATCCKPAVSAAEMAGAWLDFACRCDASPFFFHP